MSSPECAACGFANRPGALFCGSCGAQLGQSCPECGEVLAAGLAYCTACGAELEAAPAAPPIAEERKIVTVLFADLVGFTGRAERLDPEDVGRLLTPYHARLKLELERHGGTVEKFIGDAVVALFGAPLAHEDDPERTVRAALAVREAIGELNAADPTLGLRVRMGITTGEAIVTLGARPSAGEGMAAGDVVNVAARLQAAAPAGGILVDEATRRATERAIEYREAEPVHAKGKREAVPVWEVVATRARLGVDIAFRGGAPLVGRRQELDLLLDALARARRERAPQLVTLVGVPGIGKSRLLWELYATLSNDPEVFVTWRQGRSLPYGEGVSFWALGEMVKSQAGILESDDAEAAGEKLASAVSAALGEPEEARWVLRHLRPLVGLGRTQGAGREETFTAWRRFFEALAEQRPLLLVFEDVHWADDGLLDFVDHLVDWTTGVPLLVICTARPELLDRRPGWGGGKRNALTISLTPLSDEEITELLRSLGSEVRETLLARAGGNPLYAEEFVRMLSARVADGDIELPDSIQGIIAARLDTLPLDEKALLQDAAVVGKVFWAAALVAVGRLAADVVEDRLRTLERKEFVRRERRSSVAGETAYVFRHVLVRDVTYGQIPRPQRAEKHRLTAEWIESLAGDRFEDVADLVAHHYGSALEFARASGQETDDLAERARLAYREAGDRALALHAFAAAARFYGAALELWPGDDGERPYILLRHGQALFHAEGGGTDVLTEAAELLLDFGDREAAAEAHIGLGDLLFFVEGLGNEAVEHLEGAATLLADQPPSRAKVAVLANRARFHMIADEAEEAIRVGFEAFQAAEELGLDEFRAHTLNTLGVARAMIGDQGGVADLERSIAIAEDLNSPEAMRAYNNLASIVANLGDLPRAYGLYERARRAAERFGHALALQWLSAQRMDELFWTGRWDDTLEHAEAVVAAAEAGSGPMQVVDARILRARIRLARDDIGGATDDSAAAADLARQTKDPQVAFPALATYAHVLSSAGSTEEADSVATELLESWAASGATLAGPWLPELAAVLAALGRGADLAEAAKRVPTATRWLEAATAQAAGDPGRAAGIYAEIGSLPDEAYARLRAAESLMGASRRGEAEAALTLALDFFRAVDAVGYVREGEALLAPT
jgi:class 3 adenylate cyclase/tetratricopeptide (TPR) repeat protein